MFRNFILDIYTQRYIENLPNDTGVQYGVLDSNSEEDEPAELGEKYEEEDEEEVYETREEKLWSNEKEDPTYELEIGQEKKRQARRSGSVKKGEPQKNM